MAKSPLSCCLSASPVFEVQCIENEQGDTLRSQHFGKVQVYAGLPACGWPPGEHQLTPASPEAQQINRVSPQPLSNSTHWTAAIWGILHVLIHLTRRSRKTAFWNCRKMLECYSAIFFFVFIDFTDEEPETKKGEVY